jgi:hypothetical protein
MAEQRISIEERVRREVVRGNFQDSELQRLGENEGSIEAIRKQAKIVSQKKDGDANLDTSTEPKEQTRDQRNALFLIDTIDRLLRVERKLAEEAIQRPKRSPEEMNGVLPLTRATLDDRSAHMQSTTSPGKR